MLALMTAATVVVALVPVLPAVPASAVPAQSVVMTSKELVNGLPFVEPIFAGYRGRQSFIPDAAAKAVDSRGCDLRKRMIIDLATKKPKVGKGCRMTGGVWTTALGATVTKPADLIIGPVMSYKDAWAQGAFAWTPAQRLAWATNTRAPGTRTRAQSVTSLQATQAVVSTSEQAQIRLLISRDSDAGLFASAASLTKDAVARACVPWSIGCSLIYSLLVAEVIADFPQSTKDAIAQITESRCTSMIRLASNVTAWGLSVSPETLAIMRAVNENCPSTQVGIELETKLNGIQPVTPATVVPTDGTGPTAPDTTGAGGTARVVFDGYPPSTSGVAVPTSAFGLTAPVDWGDPSVTASWVRLWDTGVSWAEVEPTENNFDFTKLRASIAAAERQGSRVLYVLGNTPGWANGGKAGSVAPLDNATAVRFISKLVSEFGGRIAAYEVWNEGNLSTYWSGSQAQLAALTKGVKDAAGSTSQVLAASTGTRATNAFVTNYGDYLDELRNLGWPVDGYTVHSYPSASGGPDQRVELLGQFKTMLALKGAPVRPIWDTELNYGLAGLGEGKRDIDDQTGAAYIAQSFLQSIQYGIDVTAWYLWSGTHGSESILGVQLNPSTPISIRAWNGVRSLVSGSRMTRCADSGQVHACQFSFRGGSPYTMVWTSQGTAQVSAAGLGSRVCDLFGSCTPVVGSEVAVGMIPVAIW